MESDKVNSIVVLGQIMMYGTLVLSIYRNADSNYYIDVDYAPDGCAMISDESKEIEEQKYMFLVQKIQELLQKKNESEDEGCSDCYVEIKDVFDNTQTYTWPEDLHSETFREIGQLLNGVINNAVVEDFLSMF